MAVRSLPLVNSFVAIPAGTFVDLYTVPTDRTALVKDVRITRTGGLGALTLAIRDAPNAADTFPYQLAAGTVVGASPTPPPWWVLREAWVLRLYGTDGDSCWISVSGSLLAGDPQ